MDSLYLATCGLEVAGATGADRDAPDIGAPLRAAGWHHGPHHVPRAEPTHHAGGFGRRVGKANTVVRHVCRLCRPCALICSGTTPATSRCSGVLAPTQAAWANAAWVNRAACGFISSCLPCPSPEADRAPPAGERAPSDLHSRLPHPAAGARPVPESGDPQTRQPSAVLCAGYTPHRPA